MYTEGNVAGVVVTVDSDDVSAGVVSIIMVDSAENVVFAMVVSSKVVGRTVVSAKVVSGKVVCGKVV